MPKSKAELERLATAAKAQHVLTKSFVKQAPKERTVANHSKEVCQPTGDIDYSKYNKGSKAKK